MYTYNTELDYRSHVELPHSEQCAIKASMFVLNGTIMGAFFWGASDFCSRNAARMPWRTGFFVGAMILGTQQIQHALGVARVLSPFDTTPWIVTGAARRFVEYREAYHADQ